MSVRIGSGRFAGRELLGPPPEGRRRGTAAPGGGTRPTAARLKKSLFAVIGDELPGARVLDACAGTGALGFEAISRGAAGCVFLERSRPMGERIGKNAERLGLDGVRLLAGDAARSLRALARRGERFDAAFFDPPWSEWEEGGAAAALAAIAPLVSRFVAAVHPAVPQRSAGNPHPGVRIVPRSPLPAGPGGRGGGRGLLALPAGRAAAHRAGTATHADSLTDGQDFPPTKAPGTRPVRISRLFAAENGPGIRRRRGRGVC